MMPGTIKHQRGCVFARPFRGGSIDEAEAQYWEAVGEGCTCDPNLCFTCLTELVDGRCPKCREAA